VKTSGNLARNLALGFLGIGAVFVIYMNSAPSTDPISESTTSAFVEPALSAAAQEGKVLFEKTCVECHGRNALGTDKGPPFVHDIYNPGHHSDDAFLSAVRNGVRQHHWPYGDMPAQRQVRTADVAKIVAYIRELQAANGITYRQHRM
jgi:mono/diheme cytochrome c family protein